MAENEKSKIFPYSPDDTFKALVSMVEKSDKYRIGHVDSQLRTVSASLGMSLLSMGEHLEFVVHEAPNGTSEVFVSSSNMQLITWGKHTFNIARIFTTLENELSCYKRIPLDGVATATNAEDIPSQIKALAELRDKDILTEEEFQEKKKVLLEKM